ncbi:MAG: DUF3488 and transglutaminase-like domain-containing protein [gamma proteobacterium symbiont of Taylorina sp.]|nr:DUF3488 and transglutaminase-like domain-containing protein [gamma proteobacterium symbiont of Taylorina sp.]
MQKRRDDNQINKLLSMLNFSSNSLLPIVLLITMLPHLYTTSVIIFLSCVFFLCWFFLHSSGFIRLPDKFLIFVLIILSIIILNLEYGFVFSQKTALSLLCIMVSLKCLEIKNDGDRRNIFLIIFLAYFILATHFLYSQGISLLIFVMIDGLFLSLLLIAFNRKPQPLLSLEHNFNLLGQLFLKALPIAIILFLFFPRIPGPLWSLPDDGQTGTTGLTDKMYPGSVSKLSASKEIAFRVDFKKSPPAADKLYWRGPVLNHTDGFLWSQSPSKHRMTKKIQVSDINQFISNSKQAVSYTVTLEPHQKQWLFSLEMPVKISGDTINNFYFNHDLQLLNKNKIHQLTQYQVTSMTDFKLTSVSHNEQLESLIFPDKHNLKTLSLGRQWRKKINNDRKIIATALDYYRHNDFYYTKNPGAMTVEPSDQFLFEKKRGFCEHYASSFVLLMRAAGIPARVVTGYQGIEKNEVGNYYIVRQSNAHAWAEVWLENKTWIRIDPTAVIPADHIEADIFDTNLERLSFSSLNIPNLTRLSSQQKTALYNLWKTVTQSIDNLKHNWNNWILGYDQSKQNLLLSLMGIQADWQNLIILMVSGMAVIFITLKAITFYKQYRKTDKVYQFYLTFIAQLNHAGMSIKLSDTPYQIKDQAIKTFPRSASSIKLIIDHYIMIRYASQTDKELIKDFISRVKQLKLNNAV